MNKVKCIWNDAVNNFFSKRLLVFCIFQYSILHYYISTVKHFSIMADYPATPWILPFIGQNVYCLFVYGISVVYFYSNIPFMQKHEMYYLSANSTNAINMLIKTIPVLIAGCLVGLLMQGALCESNSIYNILHIPYCELIIALIIFGAGIFLNFGNYRVLRRNDC